MDEGTFPWRGRRVLVTGCTGFLGGAVVAELLARGAEIIGLVRDREAGDLFARHGLAGRVHVVYGRADDLFRVHSALAVYEAGAVFHLAAAESAGHDRGTDSVSEAVRRYDPRIPVVTAREGEAVPISSPAVPLGVARFGELFGPGGRPGTGVIPTTILGLLAGARNQLPDDEPARDFVHVRDAARACAMLAEAIGAGVPPGARDVNFRSGWILTGREMAAAVREVFVGRDPRFRPAEPPVNPLGWAPALNFADAIADTIDWFRASAPTRFSGPGPSDPPHRAAA